ncbi:MAG: DtxR family transcriptional regulator, Mn-dependent transcriptional regulator [Actinomycetota bacterium]
MTDGFHPPLEEYLEAICELEEENIPVIQARLAERLEHTPASVSEMIHRLRDEGFIEITGRSISLTSEGRKRAESVVRKHRLAERLLTDVIGLPWSQSHLEACRWEHVISDEVEERLVALLGNPTTCPHGNPIPGTVPTNGTQRPLSECAVGTTARLTRVTERIEIDTEALAYLDAANLRPGADAEITARAPDGTLTLEVDGAPVSLGAALTSQIYVAAE